MGVYIDAVSAFLDEYTLMQKSLARDLFSLRES
jgi:hypothetical protein